ncbi:C-terminal processing protease CtpA/Prc, contains a PDZ domain [Sinomicrobium oceani]|uniref:C-terminal processing protease CtpA/Prc, contains a PDZ domain n=1 Tax=Sinomicrobium oceani TaxID=1150368 RepID=A0A1K1Q959_9FLAO|nr:S41 family peptidase [Sinomicrobium oceani]SFW56455.1 C-terminal processing protease CtpA/Prc, contains a PDZ domain [Sinomicrobium oceani]
MKKLFYLFVSGVLLWSCSDKDDDAFVPDPSEDLEIHDFVWKGMNTWYFWQEEVNDLGDDRFASSEEYEDFLNNYATPEGLFDHLIYEDGTVDRFSWIVDDYEVLLSSFRGESDSFGFEIGGLVQVNDANDVILYVGYVVPDSPADDAGMSRGDIVYKFDNVALNTSNYQVVNNFYSNESIRLEFATVSNGIITPTGKSSTLNLRSVQENPVHFSEVLNYGGRKIGYLVYHAFRNTYNKELNDVFEDFKNSGIEELVLDLRYNGGGSVSTSAYLASMIYGDAAAEKEVFATLAYNSKNPREGGSYPFFDKADTYDKSTGKNNGTITINRLNSLTRVYVLTSGDTASASEMIINGLKPFMEVIVIGETTYGKNVGSQTLFDSSDFGTRNINPNHKYAMQPITFKIYNKNGESDYTHGFDPDILVEEYHSYENIRAFGDTEESLLSAALNDISGFSARSMVSPSETDIKALKGLKEQRFSKEMYIVPGEIQP